MSTKCYCLHQFCSHSVPVYPLLAIAVCVAELGMPDCCMQLHAEGARNLCNQSTVTVGDRCLMPVKALITIVGSIMLLRELWSHCYNKNVLCKQHSCCGSVT